MLNIIPTTRPGLFRRAVLHVRRWHLLFCIDSAVSYLNDCLSWGITDGSNLDEYQRQIDDMRAELGEVERELNF